MKTTILCLLTAFIAFGQKETSLPSTIKKVTVFFQGAQVEHYKTAELKPGKQTLIFEKLTDFMDANTVQVKATGDLTILSVRTRKNYEDLRISNTEISALNAKKHALDVKDEALRDEYAILSLDKNLLLSNRDLKGHEQGLKVAELKEAYAFMHQKLTEIKARQTAIYAELETLDKEMNRIEQEIISQRSKPVINYTEVLVEIDVEKTTKSEFIFSYITPKAGWKPYYDMRSDGIGKPVRLEAKALVNQTSGIPWNDVDVVLSTNDPYENAKEPVLNPWYLSYYNYPQPKQPYSRQLPAANYSGEKLRGEVIDASTGEPLPFAKIAFAGNPNVGAVTDFDGKFDVTVPKGETYVSASYVGYSIEQVQITAPYLKFFLKPTELELEEVVVTSANAEADYGYSQEYSDKTADVVKIQEVLVKKGRKATKRKNQEYALASGNALQLNDSGGAVTYQWSSNAVATATQKDLRMEYAIQSKLTIPSDGTDYRVQIATYELPASYEYHSTPKIDASVYLAAQVTGWEKLNLLNGESNLYFDGTYIGKTFIDVNSTKDTLSFSLGKDNKLRIERTKILEKSGNKLIGSRRRVETAWELTIRNNGGASIPLIIKDQFPLSNTDEIKVRNGNYKEGKWDEKTGIITWNFILSTGQSKSLFFDYTVDYQHEKVLYLE